MNPGWIWLAGAITLEVMGTTALPFTNQFTRPLPTALMALCYAGSFYCLSQVVQTIPIGVAYAIWAGIGIALISLIGVAFLGQTLDRGAVAGIGLIAAGVVVLNMFSSVGPH